VTGAAVLTGARLWGGSGARAQMAQPTPPEALARLMAGNARFVAGAPTHPNQTPQRRAEVAPKQRPYAMILGCADSRVPPEIVFDEGIGDLFVVRVAGNVVNEAVLASLEYSLSEFETPLLMVLGHSGCGAVKETIAAVEKDLHPTGPLGDLLGRIRPAVEQARSLPGDLLTNATKLNVERSIHSIIESEPILLANQLFETLDIVGGYYDLQSGAVEVFGT
jgi:carbonic anhydrase